MSQTIHDLDVSDILHESVSIDRTDLNGEYCRVAADLAYWGEKQAQSERAEAEAKFELERVDAKTSKLVRKNLELTETKRVTEKMIEAEVLLSPAYGTARTGVIEAGEIHRKCRSIVDAVKSKRDMLVSLGAHKRAEMQADPQINNPVTWDHDLSSRMRTQGK